MKRTVINRTIVTVVVALSVVVAGIGVADLWLGRDSSGVDGEGPAGFVTSPDAVVILPLPERPTDAETVGDLIEGLLKDAEALAHQKYASKRERAVPGIAESSRRGLM